MPLISVSEELKDLLDANINLIKGRYITLRLYADSAIREKLRRDKAIGVGPDEIIAHLKRLEQSKSQRLDKQAVTRARRVQELRVHRATERLNKQEEL